MTGDQEDAAIARLLADAAEARDVVSRSRRFAEALFGRPYISNPLMGGLDRSEVLVTGVTGFDCVTFVESVLALARSSSPAEFREEIVGLRYRKRSVAWEERLHYFSDWFFENERRGVLQIDTSGPGSERIQARLAVIEGLPPREVAFDVVPKSKLELAIPRIANASIVAFASEREGLDYFHVGLLFIEPTGAPLLIHAGKSRGFVGQEPLADFLERNSTRGISFARPLDSRRIA